MGICISVAYSEIHEVEDGHENVIFLKRDPTVSNETKNLASVFSRQGSKGVNQDAAVLYQGYGMENGAFCGVFDGHGAHGHVVSKIVRNRLPSLILNQKNALTTKMKPTVADHNQNQRENINNSGQLPSKDYYKWQEACLSAFKVMDKEVKLRENLDCSCSGTTAVVAIRQGDELVIANLGDSRAVLGTINENGELKAVPLTTDLKPNVPGEADRIRKCNGRVFALKEEQHIQRVWLPHEDAPGLAMSRAFGDFVLKNHGVIALPDISYRRLTFADQFIVLASDGALDVLSNDEVASIVWEAESEQEAANAVVEAAATAWKRKFPSSKRDDCSVVCLYLQKRQHSTYVVS